MGGGHRGDRPVHRDGVTGAARPAPIGDPQAGDGAGDRRSELVAVMRCTPGIRAASNPGGSGIPLSINRTASAPGVAGASGGRSPRPHPSP